MKKIQTNSGTMVTDQKVFSKKSKNFTTIYLRDYNVKEEITHAGLKMIPKTVLGHHISAKEFGFVL